MATKGSDNDLADVRVRINDWRRRLIDLTYRNRLIKFGPTQASTLTITAPSIHELLADLSRTDPWKFFLPPEPTGEDLETSEAAEAVDAAVLKGAAPAHEPSGDEIVVTERNPKRINRILDTLAKRSNAELQDKGLRILYLAAGFLDWVDPKTEEAIASPLVLVPVELRRRSTRDAYELFFVDDEDIVINPSLTEKLRHDAGLEMPPEWTWEDKPLVTELHEIRAAISETDWQVRDAAVLSLFSFQKYVMYRDLLDNEEAVAQHPLVQAFAGHHSEFVDEAVAVEVPKFKELDDAQAPAETFSILDADASQRLCVEAAKRGQSFVMHGPPGTGKSQTIANIISEAMGAGKRVLFVSEKAAALDVVHKRLTSAGLDEYCLMLHGEHASRRSVVEELYRCMTEHQVPHVSMTESEFTRLTNVRALLNDSLELLHLPMEELGERTPRDVLCELAELHDAPRAAGVPEPSDLEGPDVRAEFEALREIFQSIAERWHVSAPNFVWRGFAAATFSMEEQGGTAEALSGAAQRLAALKNSAGDLARALDWPLPLSRRGVSGLIDLTDHLKTSPPRLEPAWIADHGEALSKAVSEAQPAYAAREEGERKLVELFVGRELDSFRKDVDREHQVALKNLAEELGRTDSWETELPARLPTVASFVRSHAESVEALQAAGNRLAESLGQPTGELTIRRIHELIELAGVAFGADHRPEREWLSSAGLERVEKTSADSHALFERVQQERGELDESYEAGVLELDATVLLSRFRDQYTGALSKLKTSYRQDAKAIKAVRRDGRMPADPVAELEKIKTVRELLAQIGLASDRYARAFGTYFNGPDTQLDQISAAIEVARAARSLMDADSDLGKLADSVCADSKSSTDVAMFADQAKGRPEAVEAGLEQCRALAEKETGLTAGDSLTLVQTRLGSLRPHVERFAALVDELSRSAREPLTTLREVADRAEFLGSLHTARELIENASSSWEEVISIRFEGPGTDWDSLGAVVAWLSRLRELAGPEPPGRVVSVLTSAQPSWPDASATKRAADQYDEAFGVLAQMFGGDTRGEVKATAGDREFSELEDWIDELEAHIDDLGDYVEYQTWVARADGRGWSTFVENLTDGSLDAGEVVSSFSLAYWNRRLEALFAEEEGLRDDLRGEALQRWISEFRRLDRKLVNTGADRLIAKRNQESTDYVLARGSEGSIIKTEHGKKRRHRPVRKLLGDIPSILTELKPCLMMSPLSVSHFLASEHTFDVVVFDEASQVPPQDAINCIYRGAQLIVAGDSEQLPPTPFFRIAEADDTGFDEDSEAAEEDMESILDSAKALLPEHRLRWHYRSKDERLIHFSNRHIYQGALVTFPAADQQSPRKGIDLVHVPDGIYDRGKTGVNRVEALAVAERVVHHLQEGVAAVSSGRRARSVGVIAFNTQQATAISEELDRLVLHHPAIESLMGGDRLENTFVKHLEAVQGDERDVVIFSVGFGYDPQGKFTMNFGPLNKAGGRRRLNVAVTRAREKVELVTSVLAKDFRLTDGSSEGAKLLRDYISYAQHSGHEAAQGHSDDRFESSIEREIGAVLQGRGYEIVPQVGAGSVRIALGIRVSADSEAFVLGIETDGENHRRIPTARDRERLRHEVLTDSLGWTLHRIWSIEWVRNRRAEVEKLDDVLRGVSMGSSDEVPEEVEGLGPEEVADDQPRQRVTRELVELGVSSTATTLPWVVPYQLAELEASGTHYEFHESASHSKIKCLLVELVEVESPIGVDHAIRRLAGCWGLGRLGHRVKSAGLRAIRAAETSESIERRDEFLWRPDHVLDAVRAPVPNEPQTRRSIEDIAPEEIDLALTRLRDSSPGIDDDSLAQQVARVLVFDRTGEKIRSAIEDRIYELGAR